MLIPCPNSTPCLEPDYTNLSAEAPDLDFFLGINLGNPQNPPPLGSNFQDQSCVGICQSSVSQAAADACAASAQPQCAVSSNSSTPPAKPPTPAPGPKPPPISGSIAWNTVLGNNYSGQFSGSTSTFNAALVFPGPSGNTTLQGTVVESSGGSRNCSIQINISSRSGSLPAVAVTVQQQSGNSYTDIFYNNTTAIGVGVYTLPFTLPGPGTYIVGISQVGKSGESIAFTGTLNGF